MFWLRNKKKKLRTLIWRLGFRKRETCLPFIQTFSKLIAFLHDTLFPLYRRVAEIQIFEKTYLIVIKDETGLKFKMNDSTLFLIGSYAQKLVASY